MSIENATPATEMAGSAPDSSTIEPSIEQNSPAPSEPVTTPGAETENAPIVPAQPQYQPNFKFKVMEREHEIPESFRALIKDADSEKQVREIFEKAYGIDHVKTERSQLKEEYKTFRSKVEPLLKTAQELQYYAQKGDLNSYFQALGLSKAQIYQWALKQAELEELSPDQKRVYDERDDANRQMYRLEQERLAVMQEKQELMVQQRTAELRDIFQRPEVANFVKQFDQRNGPNAFWEECWNRGRSYYAMTGKDLTADEVVQEMINKFGFALQSAAPSAPQQQSSAPNQPSTPRTVPIIPNTGSGSASPAQRSIKSVDDLKKVYAEKFGG